MSLDESSSRLSQISLAEFVPKLIFSLPVNWALDTTRGMLHKLTAKGVPTDQGFPTGGNYPEGGN